MDNKSLLQKHTLLIFKKSKLESGDLVSIGGVGVLSKNGRLIGASLHVITSLFNLHKGEKRYKAISQEEQIENEKLIKRAKKHFKGGSK